MAGGSKRSSGPPGTGPPPMTHRDLFHRVNFTLQASAYLQHLQRPSPRRRSDVTASGCAASGPSRGDSQPPTPSLEMVVDRKGKRRAVEVDSRSKRKRDNAEAGADFARLAREDMKSTRDMAVHNLLKLYVSRAVCLPPPPSCLGDAKISPRPRDVL
jgi:ribonuclease P protein subunit RPR2